MFVKKMLQAIFVSICLSNISITNAMQDQGGPSSEPGLETQMQALNVGPDGDDAKLSKDEMVAAKILENAALALFNKKFIDDKRIASKERDQQTAKCVNFIVKKLKSFVYESGEQALPDPFHKPLPIVANSDFDTTLKRWIKQILTYPDLGVTGLHIAGSLVLLEKVAKSVDVVGNRYKITPLNLHGLFFTCLLLARKVIQDIAYDNSVWSQVSYDFYSNGELAKMELKILEILNYDLSISVNDLYLTLFPFIPVVIANYLQSKCSSSAQIDGSKFPEYGAEPTCSIFRWVSHLLSKPEFCSQEIICGALDYLKQISNKAKKNGMLITINNIYRLFFVSLCLVYVDKHSEEESLDLIFDRLAVLSRITWLDEHGQDAAFSFTKEQVDVFIRDFFFMINPSLVDTAV